MKNKFLTGIVVLFISYLSAINITLSNDSNNDDVSLSSIFKMSLAEGESGGDPYCYWVEISHAPDYSSVTVSCMESAYPDPTFPSCTCGSDNETWYL